MRWRKQVTAATLPELESAAERYFRPGTTYSIYSVREETPAGVFISYRAEAHPPEAPSRNAAQRRGTRRASTGVPESGRGGTGQRSGAGGPGDVPLTGRVIDPGERTPVTSGHVPAGPSAAGTADNPGPTPRGTGDGTGGQDPSRGTAPSGTRDAGPRAPGDGVVTGYNPHTVQEIPGWRPEQIPARVLTGGPGLGAAYALLQDPQHDPVPGPAFATDDPAFTGLLDRAAPREAAAAPVGTDAASPDSGAVPSARWAGQDRQGAPADEPHDPRPPAGDQGAAEVPGRSKTVYVGLLDDPVEAAERCGHRRWSAAGVLNGGQPGAAVVCYGLGDGSAVARLAEGLHRYRPMRLVLAVDPSRKHADTQAWVRQVARVVQPSSLVAVARTVTSSPGTVHELGYPVQAPVARGVTP